MNKITNLSLVLTISLASCTAQANPFKSFTLAKRAVALGVVVAGFIWKLMDDNKKEQLIVTKQINDTRTRLEQLSSSPRHQEEKDMLKKKLTQLTFSDC